MLRENYPKPNYVRPRWKSLDGEWTYYFCVRGTENPSPLCNRSVPDSIISTDSIEYAVYKKTFVLTEADSAGAVFLNISSIIGDCEVFINDKSTGKRKGAPGNLTFDVTNYILPQKNSVSIMVISDPLFSEGSYGGPLLTGRIWLEFSAKSFISQLIVRPSIRDKSIYLSGRIANSLPDLQICAEVSLNSKSIVNFIYDAKPSLNIQIPLSEQIQYWECLGSNLYEIKITLTNSLGGQCDCIHTYTAFRNIELKNNLIFLNDKVVFLKLVRDNDCISTGLYNTQKIRQVIASILSLGFNGINLGCCEPTPQFIYLADKIGLALLFTLVPNGLLPYTEDHSKLIQSLIISKLIRYIASPSIFLWNLFSNYDPGIDYINHLILMAKKLNPFAILSSYSDRSVGYGDYSSSNFYCSEKSLFIRSLKSQSDANFPSLINFSSGSFNGAYSPPEISLDSTEKDFTELYTFMTGAILASNFLGFSYDFLIDSSVDFGGLYLNKLETKLSRNSSFDIKKANNRRSIGELNSIITTK